MDLQIVLENADETDDPIVLHKRKALCDAVDLHGRRDIFTNCCDMWFAYEGARYRMKSDQDSIGVYFRIERKEEADAHEGAFFDETLARFLREWCMLVQGEVTGATELYRTYVDWCTQKALRVRTQTWFGRQMGNRFLAARTATGHSAYRGVIITEGKPIATIRPNVTQPAQPTPAPLPPATPDLDALIDRILRRQEARTLRSLTMSRAMQALIVRLDAALDADEPTLRATVREVLDDLGHAVTWGDERGAA
jgi:hypothetical protein